MMNRHHRWWLTGLALALLALAATGTVTWLWRPFPLRWSWLEPASWVMAIIFTPAAFVLTIVIWRQPKAPPEAGLVADLSPRLLPVSSFGAAWAGVHPAISMSAQKKIKNGEDPQEAAPSYIERAIDQELNDRLAKARERGGGFLLLVGNSSAGKTRSAYEAVVRNFLGWNIFLPSSAGDIQWLSQQRLEKPTIVWLDELQRFLPNSGDSSMNKETILALWSKRKPIIFLGTIWPDRYQHYLSPPERSEGYAAQQKDRIAGVLRIAERVYVEDSFTSSEMAAARALAERDSRIKAALRDSRYGVTQVLAGAPELVASWQHADCYSKALITAAVDIRRLRIEGTLTPALLKRASGVYLNNEEIARASSDWFEKSISYCIKRNRGATSVLIPVSGLEYGSIAGYELADYLTSYGARIRENEPLPVEIWGVLSEQLHDPIDLQQLASAADMRDVRRYAEAIYRRSLALGNAESGFWLGLMLWDQGRKGEAVDVLRRASSMGSKDAIEAFSDYGPTDEAIGLLRRLLTTGDSLPLYDVRLTIARLLDDGGRFDEAEEEYLQAIAEKRKNAVFYYALRLQKRGIASEALNWFLRALDAGDLAASESACRLLVKEGRFVEARAIYEAAKSRGDERAQGWWIEILVKADHLNEALALASSSGTYHEIGKALALAGKVDEALTVYKERIEQGDVWAHYHSAELLESRNRHEEAFPHWIQSLKLGPHFSGYALVRHFSRNGDLDVALPLYRYYFAKGIDMMSDELSKAMIEANRIPELIEMVGRSAMRGNDGGNVYQLCRMLESNGYGEAAEVLRRHGLTVEGVPAVPLPSLRPPK
ncbi:lipopolysaccharide assembly protein LapB [Micromonospora sp. CMU55-4]|uniref:tetratricopeptide repeat protein n=1 Tax=Micromonospora sp. CMU55-4 TaxID=2717028 RepID=UPI00140B4DAB|nr:tetratricopeptide repeat protein [Micromonospora sp. CMU55-4]NHO82715.1 tetratricopeptide repeat protein [Micromonospora sp. CMU55-4]